MIDDIKQVGVVGAGAMGAGVPQSFAVAGYPVRLQDIAEAALTRGKGAIKKSLEPKARDAALQRIAPTTRIDDFADCDVVVEAVLERFDVKNAVMENLDGVCRPETIRATNTSSISVTRIARSPPEDIGNVCSRRKAVRLSKHRRRMARNEALLVGRDDPHGDR
jgi:3-hydroxybutyryl-CoA dehydrogenase